jgi:hypothetical protein
VRAPAIRAIAMIASVSMPRHLKFKCLDSAVELGKIDTRHDIGRAVRTVSWDSLVDPKLRNDEPMSVLGGAAAAPLRLLIDSNFYITLEPYGGKIEPRQKSAAEVVRLAAEQGHKLFVHPATRDDLLEATDPVLRAQRLAELEKFPLLDEGTIPSALTDVLTVPHESSNDHRFATACGATPERCCVFGHR